MNLLLDTHTFLWFAGRQQSALLPQATRDVLEDGTNTLFLSLASIWELAIKVSIGKLQLTEPAAGFTGSIATFSFSPSRFHTLT